MPKRDKDAEATTPSDALRTYHPVCDAIALILQPYAEVVLHDLASETVSYIANNFSKRDLGEPSLLHEIDFKLNDRTIGPYEKVNFDGRRLKSVSAVLRAPDDRAIAILCINIDVSHIQSAIQVLSAMSTVSIDQGKPAALFKEDWHERVNEYVHGWTTKRGLLIADLTRAQKQQLVRELAEDGAFSGKHAAAYISKILQMGRATVYNYLRDTKA
ncbi:helix-turn-helix transcriptional regulator [Shinella granuli]|jgi:predicted transcriptional regulator YheO|uniref:Putative transcriptional regulator YheO n=1 Tax=Shinella granuli TaxID=323621 RepID=A0A4R2CVR4_SHIGR|nr:PAS domain-containing protein [Shinella granuli]TCN43459.1 putative transcriptional regulator YheO [Shinella granuli]